MHAPEASEVNTGEVCWSPPGPAKVVPGVPCTCCAGGRDSRASRCFRWRVGGLMCLPPRPPGTRARAIEGIAADVVRYIPYLPPYSMCVEPCNTRACPGSQGSDCDIWRLADRINTYKPLQGGGRHVTPLLHAYSCHIDRANIKIF